MLVFVAVFIPMSVSVVCSADGQIRVLYIGGLVRSQPFVFMKSDPLFSIDFVGATLRGDWVAAAGMSLHDVHRIIRLYMPRTYDELTSRFDVIALTDANSAAVGAHNIEMLAQGVREGGVGLLMSGGWETFGATGSWSPWGETSIGHLLPTEDVIGKYVFFARPVIDKPSHELIHSIPWSSKDPALRRGERWEHNVVTLKPGANMLAHVVCAWGEDDPLMVTWELPNRARVFALTSSMHRLSLSFDVGEPWSYHYDLGCNLMIYLDHRAVPQDIALVHAARCKMLEVEKRRCLLMSLLDFCESFGANTRGIIAKMTKIDGVMSSANEEYLGLRFEDVLESYERVGVMLEQAEEDAVKLKNKSLLWVYVIEWLAVTGTGLVCGVVLWLFMVRRRMYREVSVTRGGQRYG